MTRASEGSKMARHLRESEACLLNCKYSHLLAAGEVLEVTHLQVVDKAELNFDTSSSTQAARVQTTAVLP